MFAGMVPQITGESDTAGLAISSEHQDEMGTDWVNAATVAGKYYSGVVGTETSVNFYDKDIVVRQ